MEDQGTSVLNYVTKEELDNVVREITEAYEQIDGMINDIADIMGKDQKAITDINAATGRNIESINAHSDLFAQLNQEILSLKAIKMAKERE